MYNIITISLKEFDTAVNKELRVDKMITYETLDNSIDPARFIYKEVLSMRLELVEKRMRISDKNKLFQFFAHEHNLILTDGELDDIIHAVSQL